MPNRQLKEPQERLDNDDVRSASMLHPAAYEELARFADENKKRNETAKNLNLAEKKVDNPNSTDSISDKEEFGSGTEKPSFINNVSGSTRQKKDKGKFNFIKKKGPLSAIIATLLFGGGASFFIGASAPIAFVNNVADDLNDALAASDIRGVKMLRNKVSILTDDTVSGCSTLSIRCKFKTMTSGMVKRYNKAGIEVLYDDTVFGRAKVKGYKFQNVEMDAETFYAKAKTDPNLRKAIKSAKNMKYLTVSDNTFIKKVLNKFGISMTPPELTGSHQDRVNKLMNKAGISDIGDFKFTAYDKDGNIIDGDVTLSADGKNMLRPDGSIVPDGYFKINDIDTPYTPSQFNKARSSIDIIQTKAVKAAKTPPIKLSSTVTSVFNVLGYWDLACSIKNTIGAASVAAKVANSLQLAQYAMPVLSLVGSMKAGTISEEDAQVLGEFFTNVDTQKTITDMVNLTGDVSVDIGESPNPNYGKNVMDSNLYAMSTTGQVASPTSDNKQFSLGMGLNMLLAGTTYFAMVLDAITNLGTDDNAVCNVVQNWAVRAGGVIVGIIGMFGTAGGSAAAQGAIAIAMSLALMAVTSVLNNALTGSLISSDMDTSPSSRAAAVWTGLSVITGESAKARGMIPGNSDQIVAYAQLQNESIQDYIALESDNSSPLDTSNPYSFISRFASSVNSYSDTSNNLTSSLSKIASLVTGSFSSIIDSQVTHASDLDKTRFEQCDDVSYQNIGIDADVQCNLRYIMPDSDLELDTDEVALYMEQNGYVEENTLTGLPKGYTEPVPSESQGLVLDTLKGLVDGAIAEYYNVRNYGEPGNDGISYGKFLDYCVYRSMPYGETYQEAGAVNSAEQGWLDGTNCLKLGEPYNYFRVYTFDKTINEMDEMADSAYYDSEDLMANNILFYDGPTYTTAEENSKTSIFSKFINDILLIFNTKTSKNIDYKDYLADNKATDSNYIANFKELFEVSMPVKQMASIGRL